MPESIFRGALTESVYYILLSLITPLHGYGIMQNVSTLSNGRVELGAGTLYGALNTLLGKGWIQLLDNDENSRKKAYELTKLGHEVLENEYARLEELIRNGKKILQENRK
jgi:DNA-binding PadR family transcriptional regulator